MDYLTMTLAEARPRIIIRKARSDDSGFLWHFNVEWEPREEDSMDYGSMPTWKEALACALASLSREDEFLAERERFMQRVR